MKVTSRLLAITLTVVLSSCGGANSKSDQGGRPPASYARDFCTAFQTWTEGISARNDELHQDLSESPADFMALQKILLTFLDDTIVLTNQASEKIRAAGVPDVENGEEIAAALAGPLADSREIFVQARDDARNLPVDDPDAFVSGVRKMALGLPEQFKAISISLPDSAPPEFREAFTSEPACAALT